MTFQFAFERAQRNVAVAVLGQPLDDADINNLQEVLAETFKRLDQWSDYCALQDLALDQVRQKILDQITHTPTHLCGDRYEI